jgi:hypothetical protein
MLLSIHQVIRDLRDGGRENREKERRLPAPWLEEPEPLAMAMSDGVSGGGDGLPVTSASLRSDWDIGGATGNTDEPRIVCPGPHLFI